MRHTLVSLFLTLKSVFIALRLKFPHWRYPLNHRIKSGFTFEHSADVVELIVFNKLKHSKAALFLERFHSTVVLVAAVDHGRIWVNAYRVLADGEMTDLKHIRDPYQGLNGRFNYLVHDGKLSHVKHLNSLIRGKGYLETDPIFSLELPLSRQDMREIGELLLTYDAMHNDVRIGAHSDSSGLYTDLVLEGEIIRRSPVISYAQERLGILAEPAAEHTRIVI